MNLLVIQLSPPSRHSIPLWPKYSPQHLFSNNGDAEDKMVITCK
jgi:hypothetical protein